MGSGNCSFWAPGVFDLDDDGIAIVLDVNAQPEDKVLLAAQGWQPLKGLANKAGIHVTPSGSEVIISYVDKGKTVSVSYTVHGGDRNAADQQQQFVAMVKQAQAG